MAVAGKSFGIIGAGIAGLTTAISLARLGAEVNIFEQAPAIKEVGAGIQISANAVRVLRALGIDPEKDAHHSKPAQVEMVSGKSGKRIARLAQNEKADAPFLQFHRADLISLLAKNASIEGVKIHLGSKVQIARQKDKSVLLTTKDDTFEFDCVVGADGVRSTVREKYFETEGVSFANKIAWRALVPAKAYKGNINALGTKVFLGAKRHLVFYPLRNNSVLNIVAVEDRKEWAEEGWSIQDDPKNLLQSFSGFCPEVTDVLETVDTANLWGLFDHVALDSWVNNRVVLVGDAAHPMMPFMAQGACMAIEDAWILSQSIDKTDNINQALQAYEKERKFRATAVQKTAKGNAEIYHLANPFLRLLLHTGMRVASAIYPRLITRRFDWIYDFDPTKPNS